MIFCNIGWMGRYRGLTGQPDKIVGGGRYVRENETGHEVCNFLGCDDGKVYGHVETIRGEADRQIRIENFGGAGDSLSGIDLIWTATHPDKGGRRIVGWYRDATIFRERQHFDRPPTRQHRIDRIDTYRTLALAENAHLLDIDDRTLAMPRGPGWMGQTPWWSPPEAAADEIRRFIQKVRELLGGRSNAAPQAKGGNTYGSKKNSPDTASDPYIRYVQENEIHISPRHNLLQTRFEAFLTTTDARRVQANLGSVDLRYHDPTRGSVLVEVKPCEEASARYAIRTAMGQLLDYRHRTNEDPAVLIVVEVEPRVEDQALAISNGFGIAYPAEGTFKLVWPEP